MQQILCPVDLSDNSRSVLRYVFEINAILKARLAVVHVYESPAAYTTAKFARDIDLGLFTEARKNLENLVTEVQSNGAAGDVEVLVEQGQPAEKILDIISDRKIDLTIMAATSLSDLQRLLIGSTATRVIRAAGSMVLIIPPGFSFSAIKSIVFATDLQTDNTDAEVMVFDFAKKFGAVVNRVHVKTQDTGVKESEPGKVLETADESEISVISADTVGNGLQQFMKENPAECLAIFHRTRGALRKLTDPSLAKEISYTSAVPVLVLH